jgi:hypothetical protein
MDADLSHMPEKTIRIFNTPIIKGGADFVTRIIYVNQGNIGLSLQTNTLL